MKIEDVLRETVAAIFSSDLLRRIFVLKGGAALQLGEGMNNRLSTDIDLSVPLSVQVDPALVRVEMLRTLTDRFVQIGFDVIDAKLEQRPRRKREGSPEVWGGWNYEFKLAATKHRSADHTDRQKWALVPVGGASSKIEVQISEHEYCDKTRIQLIDQVEVLVYTPALLIAEKLRAICQQHPDYPHHRARDRARDFFDIYAVLRKHHREPDLMQDIAEILEPVFAAKYVPLQIIERGAIFESAFLSGQEAGFQQVRDTARGTVQEFAFYVEQLKLLVRDLLAVRR